MSLVIPRLAARVINIKGISGPYVSLSFREEEKLRQPEQVIVAIAV